MLFSSITFLYFFFPVFLAIYFILPRKLKNIFLLAASVFFYFCGEPKYVILLMFSCVFDFIMGLWIGHCQGKPMAKLAIAFSICMNLGILFFFKYLDFFIGTFNSIFHTTIPIANIPLPLGISFFTFQTMSYTIDVYRGNTKVQRSFVDFATYVTMFPQLVAGPIVRYVTVGEELKNRVHSWDNLCYGTRRFVLGLAKKVLIANQLGELVVILNDKTSPTVFSYWLAAIAFALQIYFDFSGYSDMAIGMGRMLGFHFLENFNYPFIAKSISDFWHRWHISMTTWFREYVYYSLRGNRVSKRRWLFNIFVVWLCTGIWHGASWNYVLWGLFFAVIISVEKFFLADKLKKAPSVLAHLYVLFFIAISFVLFYNEDLSKAYQSLLAMFGAADVPLVNHEVVYYLKSYGLLLMLAMIGSTPLSKLMADRIARILYKRMIAFHLVDVAIVACLLLLSTAYLIDSSYNPFLYFRF